MLESHIAIAVLRTVFFYINLSQSTTDKPRPKSPDFEEPEITHSSEKEKRKNEPAMRVGDRDPQLVRLRSALLILRKRGKKACNGLDIIQRREQKRKMKYSVVTF